MKILAICFQYDDPMPVIASNLLGELTSEHTIDVLSNNVFVKPIEGLRHHYIHPFPEEHRELQRQLIKWTGRTPISYFWSRRVAKVVARDYDVVLAFMDNANLTSIVAGEYLSKKLGCKFALYTVDAFPAPGGWLRKKVDFWNKKRIANRIFSAADLIGASNSHMLDYQLSVCKPKPTTKGVVLLTPSPMQRESYPKSEELLFLYTGNLYGLRNPDHIFKAFKRVLALYPTANFMIVGMIVQLRNMEQILTEEERKHIIIGKHTNNLAPLFERAKVLVDIDADREKDPFMSSKIVSYLKVNRVILSETGKITPSREMFAGLNTVVQCDHNEESLYEGMLRAIELADSNPDFSEREPLVEKFSIERVASILNESLKELHNTK